MNPSVIASLALAALTASQSSRPVAAPPEAAASDGPAALFFGEVDGDGLMDVFSVGATGHAKLLRNQGKGEFEDITLAAGLADLEGVTFGLFADVDGNGTLDLYVGRSGDGARLYRNHGNASFEPVSLDRSGQHVARDVSARVFDVDHDGALDLHVRTESGDVVYRSTVRGFERMELGTLAAPTSGQLAALPMDGSSAGGVLAATSALAGFCWPTIKINTGHRLQACTNGGARILGSQGNTAVTPAIGFFSTNGVDDGGGGNGIFRPLANTMAFATVSAERMRITSGGNVGIGTASPSERLHVIGNILASGTITPSDARFKKNVEELEDALAMVRELRGVRFDWKQDEFPERGFDARRQIGFLAQEVAEVLPELVNEGSDGYLAVDYSKLTPVLVEAVQAQQGMIAALEQRVAEREADLAELATRFQGVQRIEAELASLKTTLQSLAKTD